MLQRTERDEEDDGALAQVRRGLSKEWRGRYLPPPWTYDDLLQETHANLCESLGMDYLQQMKSTSNDSTGALKNAARRAIREARANWWNRRKAGLPQIEFGNEGSEPSVPVDAVLDFKDVFENLDDLSFQMIEFLKQGHSVPTVAGLLQLKRATAYRLLDEIRRKLRRALRMTDDSDSGSG